MTSAAELAELQQAILKLHGAKAEHMESVPVTERFQGQTVWDGVVAALCCRAACATGRLAAKGSAGGRGR